MSASKFDHKELERRLKEDEIALFFHDEWEFCKRMYHDYGKQILTVLIVVALFVIGGSVWKMKSSSNLNDSQRLYSNAVNDMQSNQYPQALNELNTLLKDYSGSGAAVMGQVLRGNCYAQDGKYEEALNDYKAALPKLSDEDALPVRFAIIQALRSMKKPDEALKELDTVKKLAQSDNMKGEELYLRGCCLEDLGKNEEALAIYKSISAKSYWYSLALDRLHWLEAQAAEPINP